MEWLERKSELLFEQADRHSSKTILRNTERLRKITYKVFRNVEISNTTNGLLKQMSEDKTKGQLVEFRRAQYALQRALKVWKDKSEGLTQSEPAKQDIHVYDFKSDTECDLGDFEDLVAAVKRRRLEFKLICASFS